MAFKQFVVAAVFVAFAVLLLSFSVYAGSNVGKEAPEISAKKWFNTEPLTLAALRGKVVLLEFWGSQ